MKKMSCDSKPL